MDSCMWMLKGQMHQADNHLLVPRDISGKTDLESFIGRLHLISDVTTHAASRDPWP